MKLGFDVGDFQLRHGAAGTFFLVEALAALEFEGDNLFAAELADYLGGDGGAFHRRGAEGHVSVIFHHKHLIEACFGTLFKGIDAFNVDHVALLDAVLLATCFENCVCHYYHC